MKCSDTPTFVSDSIRAAQTQACLSFASQRDPLSSHDSSRALHLWRQDTPRRHVAISVVAKNRAQNTPLSQTAPGLSKSSPARLMRVTPGLPPARVESRTTVVGQVNGKFKLFSKEAEGVE